VDELGRFNGLGEDDAVTELLACNASRRWAEELAAGRPYRTLDEVERASAAILDQLDWADITDALAAHPRIGERAGGASREAAWSRREQSGAVSAPAEVAVALAAGNQAYEQQFGHVFLICATGLGAEEMLAHLRRRLGNDVQTERDEVRAELAKITALRLAKLLTAAVPKPEPQPNRISLGANSYGKSEIRLVRVARERGQHTLTDLNVSVALAGDLVSTHLTGDNTDVLPTDTQKNTVFAFAKEYGVDQIEQFGLRLARHFVDAHPAIHRARVHLEQYGWDRVDRDTAHSFVRSGQEIRTATVTYDGDQAWVVSGLTGLTLLNSTASEFKGFRKDAYTTLPETDDRILATDVTARWRHTGVDVDFGKSYPDARRHLIEAFAGTYSWSLQQTLYAMGSRLLEQRPDVCEVRLSLPNRHHLLVDLSPFGLENRNEVFYAADRPYGLIEGTVTRDGAPAAGLAWW
jgi:urate oxidase